MKIIFLVLLFTAPALKSCSKKTNGGSINTEAVNHPPTVTVSANLISANPFTFKFTAVAADQDIDPLTYKWYPGIGDSTIAKDTISFIYSAGNTYTVSVSVTDGKSKPVIASVTIDTKLVSVLSDNTKKFQSIDGFGGFGAQDAYFSNGPYTSDRFVNDVVNDLGITILRDEIPTNFEYANDNADPFITDLTKYNLTANLDNNTLPLGPRISYFKALKAAGVQKFIATVWSPPAWMKNNNSLSNGTATNAAPAYNTSPDATSNQLKITMYNEFAEMCVAYVRVMKQEADIDLYALSIQNEPRFSQSYQSCVYNGAALRDLLKVVGKRFHDEGLTTKLFVPEDVGYLEGVQSMVDPILQDPIALQYADIVAVHGYDLDGVTAASTSALTWQTMYGWAAGNNKPLWMTETSGYENTMNGAVALGKGMYTALKYGNISAWVFWSISTGTLDSYSLMSSTGQKSKRYFVSKNFYRYIRPGAVRTEITTGESNNLLPLFFVNTADQSNTIVIINDSTSGKAIQLSGTGLSSQYNIYITSITDDCKDYGTVNSADAILIPSKSVVTLYHEN